MRDRATANESPAQGLPDVLARGLRVVFCGINPGMQSAVAGHHFATRSNRFWRVLHLSGFTPELILPPNAESLLDYGCGLTSAVERPTITAQELGRHEFLAARPELENKIVRYAPGYIAFLGKAACSAIFERRNISWGRQEMRFGGAAVWVLPNPSGLNRAFDLKRLTAAYGELVEAAG